MRIRSRAAFPGIVMVARFSKQKDHATLLRAVARLRDRGLHVPCCSRRRQGAASQAAAGTRRTAGHQAQVQFLGVVRNVPELLMTHRIAALITHYEGMPLAMLEGMAAGCAVVASAVPACAK
jgi:glycosyltransferase involved in cell wall biosynthesis